MFKRLTAVLVCTLALSLGACSFKGASAKQCPYMQMKSKCESGCKYSCKKMEEMKSCSGSCNKDGTGCQARKDCKDCSKCASGSCSKGDTGAKSCAGK